MSILRLLIILLPWLELFTLIRLGIATSALTALLYVLATLLVGVLMLQRQGRGLFERLRQAQEGGIIGPEILVDDMALGLAGLLLIFPGMITDVAAVLVMIGPLRRRLIRLVRGPQPESYTAPEEGGDHVVIEGSYRRVDEEDRA